MKEKTVAFKRLIERSDSILVISHISPDPDALCSLLLAGTTLTANYPAKRISMNSEELTGDLSMLSCYKDISMLPLQDVIAKSKPELIIITDAMNFQRCTRADAEAVRQTVRKNSVKVIIVDHHEPDGVEPNDVYINNQASSATEEIYRVLFQELDYAKPEGYATTCLLGIISDTNRFMYDNPGHRDTFDIVNELLDVGASIEKLENLRTRYTKDQMSVLAELAANAVITDSYNYSFISDEFKSEWSSGGKSPDELKLGCHLFVNDYIRNLGDNYWGFMIYPDLVGGTNIYSVSFRAMSGIKDVSAIAKRLGGGGHKASAAAKFGSQSVDGALKQVKQAIAQS